MSRYLTLDELNAGLDHILGSPQDGGRVEMLIVRPMEDQRTTPETAEVSAELGLHGDHWSTGNYRDEPDVQVAMMSSRVLDLVSGGRDRWALAGDNIIVDLDLSQVNLVAGQKLEAGTAVLEITEVPHRGCAKFSSRFGADALRFVNLGQGRDLRLRGVYARVVQPGSISVGDQINKL
jgi:MOSC domain-containing protein YiiM